MPSINEFYLCCGARIVSSFHIFDQTPSTYNTKEQIEKTNQLAKENTENLLKNNTNHYALYIAILKDKQIMVNEQLLFKYGFRRVARGLNPVHSGSNNTMYVKARTEGWGKTAVQTDLDSFNPTPVHMDLNALVVEQEDTEDLKSSAKKLVGSSPTKGTKLPRNPDGTFKKKEELVPPEEWRVGDVLAVIDPIIGRPIGTEVVINSFNREHDWVRLTISPNVGWFKRRFEFVRKGPNWEV